MSLSAEIERQRKGQTQKRDAGSVQTRALFGNWVISRAVDLGCRYSLYGLKDKTQA